jgi:feruloyl-CoA synthase
MNAPLPPFRRIAWPARDIAVDRRGDGSIVMRSRVPLNPYPAHLPGLLRRWGGEAPERSWLAQRRGPDRAWRRVSYGEALATVDAVAQALIDLGLGPERPVMILSANSLEHALLTMAAMQVGAPAAPVSPAYSLVSRDHAKLRHVFELVRPGLVFVQDGPPFDRALGALDLTGVTVVHVGRAPTAVPTGVPSLAWDTLAGTRPTDAVAARLATVGPETVGKLLFTSGSTGMPKAVPNTQRMMCANLVMYLQCRPRDPSDPPPQLLDWLPWNHTMGGNALFNPVLADGGTLHIDDGRPVPGQFDETIRNLHEVAPTYMSNVPAAWAMLANALEADEALAAHFFSRLRLMGYGGATLPDDLYRRLQSLAIRHTGQRIVMVTGWGCTETGPTATSTYWDTERVGLIGLPYPGIELKLVPTGGKFELRIRGPIVMAGYHRQPELTAKAFDEEGFYMIGDAATFVDPTDPSEGLVFAGRVVEDFKLASGTFVHVGTLRVAAIASASPVLQDALVAGQDRPYVGLLAWPNVAACRVVAGLPEADVDTLVRHPAVLACLRDGLRAMNAEAGGSSGRVGRVMLLTEPPSVDGNEMTDKGYVNQRAGLERRAAWVARLYAEPPGEDVIEID